jgi:hypothetical protein
VRCELRWRPTWGPAVHAAEIAPRPCDDWPCRRCAPAGSLTGTIRPPHRCCDAIREFLRASGAALLARRLPPRLDGVESALDSYAAAIAAVRNDGLTRAGPRDETERFFALCFALEQMRHNLHDLHRCVTE